ncbi:60Kd inner membrane protein-domain-containing protein [Mycena crocata]|nr:60Kd inner membrane protein-domain-containing protein [Mycena crocata]
MASFSAFRVSTLGLASSRSPVLVPRYRLLSTLALNRCQRPQPDPRWRNARWNSSAAAPASQPLPPTPSLEPPLALESTLPDSLSDSMLDPGMITDTVAAIPPLQHGELHALGLCHWTPAGLVQYSFELTHVLTGLPWFYTFVGATLFWRVVIFPFAVIGMRNSARMRPYQEQMSASAKEMAAARAKGDTVGMQRASIEGAQIRSKAGASMWGLMAPMVQFPISIGMFLGIKKMCELPVLQLTQSGFAYLPDLTQPGPYFILPILVAASGNWMISLSSRDMDTSNPIMGHIMNIFRVISVLAIWWMNHLPSGLLVCLLVTSWSAVVQTLIFRAPALRAALKIPAWTPPPSGSAKLPTLRETFRHFFMPQKQAPGITSRPNVYIPPSAPLKTPAPPANAPRTLDVLAQEARARASVQPSSLFEETAPPAAKESAAPAPVPTAKESAVPAPAPASKAKAAKAARKPRAKRA